MTTRAFRATVLHCLADPGESAEVSAAETFEDGLLVVEDGKIAALGPAGKLLPGVADRADVVDYTGKLIVPGLIDCHVHFPQLEIIGSYGEQLLDWLNHYAYPAEAEFADADHARSIAELFVAELLRHGTTTALVFATVHPTSATAIFEAAAARNMRLIAGKVLMDRNCPANLRDSPESGYKDSKALIERWHGNGRLGYAITPRFALTSSHEQLAAAGRLANEHPDVWVHTHLAENRDEIAAVAKQFPDSRSYLDVYDARNLVRERAVFAHCLHLDDEDRHRLAERRAAAAFCPTSNLFLGSGLFDLRAMINAGVRVGLATDVGGGTTLSLLKTMGEAYKVLQLRGENLPAMRALYLATLGAAEALHLDDRIGNFERGKEADFIVLDAAATGMSARRAARSSAIDDQLFALLTLGDERHVAATYVEGCRQ